MIRWSAIVVVAMLLPQLSYAQIDAAALARSQRNNGGTDIYGNPTGQNGFGADGMPLADGEMGAEGETADSTERRRESASLLSHTISAIRCEHCPTGSGVSIPTTTA